MKSVTSITAAVALLSGAADAFWRMECKSRLGLARLDPIVEPDEVASHAHVIHGGSSFSDNSSYDDLRASDCTSCRVTQDTSAYWTPSLHFIHDNGTTELVEQVGGMLAYYLLYGENITAFPAGFRLLAGDTRQRNFSGTVPDPAKSDWTAGDKTQFNLSQKALGFNCLNYAIAPEGSLYRHFLPDKDYLDANCADGIRAELMFPSCWNGKDLDATNHKDHMKYPDLVTDGVCPEGFETRTPSLFYETIWNTYAYKGVPGQFVFANGDPTGYGYHGDFINGWDIDFLQSAVDTCTNPSGEIEDCPLFDVISEEEAAKCTLNMPKVLAKDDCAGPSDGLCGNVPIQYGPGYASALNAGGTAVPTIASSLPASTGSGAVTTSIMAVPTLSYKTATGAVTDSYGGGISIANVNGDISQNGEKTNSPKTTLATISSTSIAAAATLIVTSAPVSAPADNGKIVSTTTYTSAGTVYEVAIQEVDVYVTVEAADPAIDAVAATSTVDVTEGATTTVLVYETVEAKKRHARHVHMHHRRDREHGLLGRY